jgi:hypothetical protein
VNVHDKTGVSKNAGTTLGQITHEVTFMEEVLGLQVAGLFTDNSGEMRRARIDGRVELPHIIWGECWAHQVHANYRRERAQTNLNVEQPHLRRCFQGGQVKVVRRRHRRRARGFPLVQQPLGWSCPTAGGDACILQ